MTIVTSDVITVEDFVVVVVGTGTWLFFLQRCNAIKGLGVCGVL